MHELLRVTKSELRVYPAHSYNEHKGYLGRHPFAIHLAHEIQQMEGDEFEVEFYTVDYPLDRCINPILVQEGIRFKRKDRR